VYYAPVDDFELSVTTLDGSDGTVHPLPGRGPRILLCVDGAMTVVGEEALTLARGQSAFVPAADGQLSVTGSGTLVQADVP
jgi:mannose-6-phosphate isomerase